MKRMGDICFTDILPDSIRQDSTVLAAAESLDQVLKKTTLAVPSLLIWARLDRDHGRIIAPLARLATAAGGLKPHSTAALELLAWQLHVDFREVATDDRMLERMVLESIPWHRIKGTPGAVEKALAMYGVDARCDESGTGQNWAVYELELAEPPTTAELANIIRVAEMSAPKRCWLRRVHGKYDLRPTIWDEGPPWDEGFWDDDSGVWNPDLNIKESFGRGTAFMAEAGPSLRAALGIIITRPVRAFYIDRAIWDIWSYDTPVTPNYGFSRLRLHSMQSRGIEGPRYYWSGPWDQRQWSGGYSAPARRIHHYRQISKSQMVWDESCFDDPLKTFDRCRKTLVDKPMIFDESLWDSGSDLRTVYIDELSIRSHSLAANGVLINARAGIAHHNN